VVKIWVYSIKFQRIAAIVERNAMKDGRVDVLRGLVQLVAELWPVCRG